MTGVRFATGADVDAILSLLTAMHAESRYARWPIDEPKLRRLVCLLIDHADGACIVAEHEGAIVGALVGGVMEFDFSRARYAGVQWLYVSPEHRASTWAAARLAKAFIDWADTTDAVEVQAGVTAAISDAAAERFYSKIGFASLGRSFAKGLDHVRAG